MFAHLLFRLAPTAVRLWLLLNRGLDELATTKATLGATQETGIAAFGFPGTSRIHAFLAGVYPPTPPKHEPDDGDDDDEAGDGGTRDDDESGGQQFSSRRRTATATEICLNVTDSLDELANTQAVEHKDEPRRRTAVRQTDHNTILITSLN